MIELMIPEIPLTHTLSKSKREQDGERPSHEGIPAVDKDSFELDRESFKANFEVVRDMIEAARSAGSLAEGYKKALAYRAECGHPQLALQIDLMLSSMTVGPVDRALQQLQGDKEAIKQLPVEERDEARTENKLKIARHKRVMVGFNHGIRELVAENPHAMSISSVTNWLDHPDYDRTSLVGTIKGAFGEVAAQKILSGVKGVVGVEYGSVDDDLVGKDLWVKDISGKEIGFDVKNSVLPQEKTIERVAREGEPDRIILRLDSNQLIDTDPKPGYAETIQQLVAQELGLTI